MRKKLLAFLSNSIPSLTYQKPFNPMPTTLALSRQDHLLHVMTRPISTSSNQDNLRGLIDPEEEENAVRAESFSNEEFELLKHSLLKPISKASTFDPGKSSNDAVSIANAVLNSDDGFGNDTQKFLGQFRGKLNESLVVEVLSLLKNAELGVKFFTWAGRQIGYSHTMPVYDALLELMESGGGGGGGIDGSDGSYKNERIPERCLCEIKDDDKEVLGKLLNILIQRCCRDGRWNVALEELGRLKDFGYKPSRWTYNALVQVFVRAGRLDSAHLVHREMLGLGYRMDAVTLGNFAHFLCKLGKWREALALIQKEEFVPNTVLYTQMISGLCEASLFEEAMDFLNRMRVNSCIPNVVTYRVLLCGCLRKKKLGRCKRILSMMITEGCYPSRGIFNSLVHAYCRSGDYSYAYKLLKKMVKCGYQPGYVIYNILIGGICGNVELPSADAMDLADKVYSEMLEAGVVLNKINVSNFARCLCGFAKFEQAYNVIRQMMNKGFVPDTSTYSKVIGYLCNASKIEEVFLLFQEMKKNGLVPDVYTYTILIDSFCKVGLIEQAHNWLNEMERDGCAPNVVTYTALIHVYLKARKVSEANALFEMMLSKGCIPNIVTYTALIDGHCKAGKTEIACQIYSRMKEDNAEVPNVDIYFRAFNDDSRDPNVFTYGALVDGLCKAHKVKEAHDLLESMTAEGCEPNHIIYDALIDGFCKAGKLEEAQEVLTKMLQCGYSPNVYTYSCLIDRLFKDKRLDLALKVLSRMLENSCAPNIVIYTEMVDGLCKVGKMDEASKLMTMMEEKGCHPNVVTYTAIIDGFGKTGRVDKCLELLQRMVVKGCAPNYVTYRVLINHCCAAGFLDEAYNLLEEMKQTYWPRHTAGYRKVIEGFNRNFLASHGLLVEMSASDDVPMVPVYRVMIDNFIKAGQLETALELLEELSSVPPFSTSKQTLYISLMMSLLLASNVDRALELYADMISKVGVPELSILVHLIKELLKLNRWEEALQLSYSICQMDIQWAQGDAIGTK